MKLLQYEVTVQPLNPYTVLNMCPPNLYIHITNNSSYRIQKKLERTCWQDQLWQDSKDNIKSINQKEK